MQATTPNEAHLASLVQASDGAIMTRSLDGAVLTQSPAATGVLGYTAEEAVGRHVSVLFPPERLFEEDKSLKAVLAGEPVRHFRTNRLPAHGLCGSNLVVEVTEYPLIGNPSLTEKILRADRSLGVGIAMNDFGTRWTSSKSTRCLWTPWPTAVWTTGSAMASCRLPNDWASDQAVTATGTVVCMHRSWAVWATCCANRWAVPADKVQPR